QPTRRAFKSFFGKKFDRFIYEILPPLGRRKPFSLGGLAHGCVGFAH
ncbi:MAG: hypothetical protein ACI9HB_003022, partial [Gammaproteobacteria bacterium]